MSTHLEHISDIKFNSSFRNMLRDYYAYGFKEKADFAVSNSTYKNDRDRLNAILKDYMDWPNEGESASSVRKNITFITFDSQSMKLNPFHRVYRFCGSDRPDYLYCFFHTLVALSNVFDLSEGIESLGLDDKIYVRKKRVIKKLRSMKFGTKKKGLKKKMLEQAEWGFIDNLVKIAEHGGLPDNQVNELKEEITQEAAIILKTAELQKFYPQNTRRNSRVKKLDNRTANNRLQRLNNIGVISCIQTGGNQSEKPLESQKATKPGERNWYLSKLTLQRLIDAGASVNDEFIEHLSYALDFYSKTFLYGEIGTYLLDRLKAKNVTPIRIKHEYFMHSLNDFNVIDLMDAIEKKSWCLISYKREKVQTKLLCFPIELRISSTTGREYLMFYEPFKKSCASLRLEFIESIQCYRDDCVKKALSDYYCDEEISDKIDRNINSAKSLMNYIWGVSTGEIQEENVEKLNTLFKDLCLRIAYNKDDKNGFLLKKLYRESRIGSIRENEEAGYIDFTVTVTDINEAKPFIRRFYENIISCDGFEDTEFSIEMDIQAIEREWGIEDKKEKEDIENIAVIEKIKDIDSREDIENSEEKAADKNSSESDKGKVKEKSIWGIDKEFQELLGEGEKEKAHDKLFNEVFGAFYHIFAAIISEICNVNSNETDSVVSYTAKEIDTICKKTMLRYKEEYGSEMERNSYKGVKVFADLLKKGGFLVEENDGGELRYKPMYETFSSVDLYKEVIPLSELEIRWLKTIISDEKIRYFFSKDELHAIESCLKQMAADAKPFPMDVVNYYDRYKYLNKKQWNESDVLVPVLDAIRKDHKINIKYVSDKHEEESGDYKPIIVEYSKRDNRFKGYFLSCRKKGGLKIYNLNQCISVEDTGKKFNPNKPNSYYEEFRKKNMAEVRIQFDDKQNLADRVLTEFSPWEKRCIFDPETGVYELTIFYQKRDGKELALRLLEFGPNIKMCDPEHKLSGIVRKKLRAQKELMKKQIEDPVRSENRTGRSR